jgi:hypothetical protein
MVIEVAPVGFDPTPDKDDERTAYQYLLISTLMDDVELFRTNSGVEAIKMTRSLRR